MRAGVIAAYLVHLQAMLPCDELSFTREADVVAEGLALEKGTLPCPQGRGWGSRSIWSDGVLSRRLIWVVGIECPISSYYKGLRRIFQPRDVGFSKDTYLQAR